MWKNAAHHEIQKVIIMPLITTAKLLFSTENTLFTFQGYSVSFVELLSTVLSLWAYIEIIRQKAHGLVISMLGSLALACLFYQIRLYSDMLLMLYYIAASAFALAFWQRNMQQRHANRIRITRLKPRARIALLIGLPLAILLLTGVSSQLHIWFPKWFPNAAGFIYYDATTTILGITASILLIRRKLECMLLWLIADIISLTLYAVIGIHFLAGVYAIYLIADITGLIVWTLNARKQDHLLQHRLSQCLRNV